jgi:putative transposase
MRAECVTTHWRAAAPDASCWTMARPLRQQVPGGIYHVYTRGVDRRRVFLDRLDRERFQWQLADVVGRYGWSCLAFCQMGTHYHCVLQLGLANLDAGMKRLNQCYAQSFNRKHRRTGYLFESRYKARHVQDDTYLLNVLRYLPLNPLHAGLCDDPLDWEWSSFRQTVRHGGRGLVSTTRALDYLGPSRAEAARRLDAFVREHARYPACALP